jgi:hypothetical protein
VEIKVGIQHVNREIVVDAAESAKDIESSLAGALRDGKLFALTDERGRKVLIPADRIAYLDIGEENARHVGFGSV